MRRMNSIVILFSVISWVLFYSSFSIAAIDYFELEKAASTVVCAKQSLHCQQLEFPEQALSSEFKVDGIALPSDALRDVEQQQAIISAGLYIKSTGDVAQLPSPDEVALTNEALVAETKKRNKTLPIKLFSAPEIGVDTPPIVIKVGE